MTQNIASLFSHETMIVSIDLIVKMNVEEKILIAHYEGYKDYMKGTKQIIPFVY